MNLKLLMPKALASLSRDPKQYSCQNARVVLL